VSAEQNPDDPEPLLRVVRGEPTDEELAALVVVVAALGASGGTGAAGAAGRSRSGWADRSALLRRPPAPGAGAWVRSGRPA
jgi:hypothetical protein